MRLVRLQVSHFGCIDWAQIEFGPGLNVLYGANDVGKSTLAASIRAGLLWHTGSAAIRDYIPWTGGDPPEVALELRTNSEWLRVEKRWNPTGRGRAVLARSENGVDFLVVARGRDVETRLRAALGWGLAEQGRGLAAMPTSYLASALLAEQPRPYALFERSLAADATASARDRLNAALAAMGRDRVFEHCIARAQLEVSEAFTPTGKRKIGQTSPAGSLELEYKRLHTQYQRLCDLREQRRALQTQRDELKRTVDLVTERWSRSQRRYAEIEHLRAGIEHRRALQERCDDLEEKLARMQALGREVEQLRAETMRLDTVLRHSVTELGEAAEAKRLAEARLAKVQTELEQCRGSDEDPQAIAGLRETEFELRDVEDRIARLEALTEHLELATAEFETHSATLHRSKQRLESARAIEHEAECAGERVAARLARSQLDRYVCERAEKAQLNAEIRALECQIEAEEAERDRLTEAIAARTLPTADDLAELGRIHARLHRSEQAEVGLQATIELDLGVPVELLCDGKRVELTVGPVLAREALSLRIPRVGNIDVVACGGTREDDRGDELAALMVALRRAGVADWEALERAYAERCADEGRIAEIERSLVMATRVLEAKLAHARQQTSEQAIEHARVGERVAAAERELDDVRARLAALQGARGDRARDELERTRHELQAQRARWHKQIAEHRTRFEAQRGAASEAVAETTRELQRALGREGAAQARCAQVRTELSEANGRLRAYLEQLEAFDRARAHDELQRIRASLEAAAEPEHGEDLELAQQDLHSARAQLDDAREQLAHCDGMIAQLGRGPSEADLAEYTAALADLERRVGEAHVRSDAWKALLEAALHVKAQQHRHIGDQLAPLLAERLAELTKGRYAGIVLSPDLALESVLVAGQRVAIDRLSEGVKEQLATLVRLVIAEQLRSFVVLDDQLAQTDADRGAWFRGVLSRSAKTSQVIALTCRPQDYLEPDQFAGPFEPHRCVDGRLTAIAVEHVIARTRG